MSGFNIQGSVSGFSVRVLHKGSMAGFSVRVHCQGSVSVHSSLSTLGQILPVIRFAWKTVAEMAENRDLCRGPSNITSSGSLDMEGLSTFI